MLLLLFSVLFVCWLVVRGEEEGKERTVDVVGGGRSVIMLLLWWLSAECVVGVLYIGVNYYRMLLCGSCISGVEADW